MKKLFLSCLIACLTLFASAQKNYFLYLQTDDQSPFYVRMADKIYSSSMAGYLILPHLNDSTYHMGVGFPKSVAPETRFAVSINQNDKGYLLKNFSDGLALFDIEELSILKSTSANRDKTIYETKTDKFSSILSKAADDPGLLKVPVAKKEEPKAEPAKKEEAVVKKEEARPEQKEAIVAKAEEKKPAYEQPRDSLKFKPAETVETKIGKKEESVKNDATLPLETTPSVSKEEVATNTTTEVNYKPSVVLRRSESSTTEGFGIVYFDKRDAKTDTVRILIPSPKFTIEQDVPSSKASAVEKKTEIASSAQELPKVEAKDSQVDAAAGTVKEKAEQKAMVEGRAKATSNTSCKELASDKDFMKLRKNMAAKSSDEDMIFEAKKAFRIRCYTSEQVRYLSTLFLTPAAKYQFFDAAYNFISDKENFAALQSEIKEDYYLKRFKALAGE